MDYDPLIFMFMYASAIFFSAIAINRETMLPSLIASIFWIVTGLCTFVLGPTTIGIVFAWMGGAVSFVFTGVFFYSLINGYVERKNERFEVRPY